MIYIIALLSLWTHPPEVDESKYYDTEPAFCQAWNSFANRHPSEYSEVVGFRVNITTFPAIIERIKCTVTVEKLEVIRP